MKKPLALFIILLLFFSFFFSLIQFPTVKAVENEELLVSQENVASYAEIKTHHPSADYNVSACYQTFIIPSSAYEFTTVTFQLGKTGSPTVNVTAYVYNVESSIPTGEPLATSSSLNASTISSYTNYNFTFSEPYVIEAGTAYAVTLEASTEGTIDPTNRIFVRYMTGNPYSDGGFCWYYNGAWAAPDTLDAVFYVYGVEVPSLTVNSNIATYYTVDGEHYLTNTTSNFDAGSHTVVVPEIAYNYYKYDFEEWSSGNTANSRTLTLVGGQNIYNVTYSLSSKQPSDNVNIKTVETINASYAIRWQQKNFYAEGRFWVFYIDSDYQQRSIGPGYVYYTSSVDRETWETPTLLLTILEQYGENVQVLQNSEGDIHVFIRSMYTYTFYYNKGTPNANGTITWADDWQGIWLTEGGTNTDFYATLDADEYPYIIWAKGTNFSNQTVYVRSSDWKNGTWHTDLDMNITSGGWYTNNRIIPLSNGDMYFIYFSTNNYLKGRLWNGTLGAEEQLSDYRMLEEYSSGKESWANSVYVDENDTIHFAFTTEYNNLIYTYKEAGSDWSSETTIQEDISDYASPSFVFYDDTLYIFWLGADATSILFKSYNMTWNNPAWTPNPVYFVEDTIYPIPFINPEGAGFSGRLNAFAELFGDEVALLFITNSTVTGEYFDVNFAFQYMPFFYETAEPQTFTYSGNPQSLYFRSDSYTTNGVTAYGLDTDYTNDYATLTNVYGVLPDSIQYGFRVYKVSKSGATTEYTGGTPEAIIEITDSSEGYVSSNWNFVGETWRVLEDAFKVVIYISFNDGASWQAVASFISNPLDVEEVSATTWVFTLYTRNVFSDASAFSIFVFGDGQFKSGIADMEFTIPDIYTHMLNALVAGDFIIFLTIPLESVFGSWVYFILIVAVAGAFYIRYRNIVIILTLFILFGVAGGFVGALIPSPVDVAVWVALTLGLTGVLWRVFR